MSKTIWLINEYGTLPQNGYGGRVYYLAKNLSKMGFKVYYIVARNHHLLRDGHSNPKSKLIDGINVISINSLTYSHSTSIKRVFNWFFFNFQLLFINLFIRNRPDFIFASSPSPFVGFPLIILSKIFSSKSCFDVRDVWPLTLNALGNVKETSLAYKIMAWAESFSLKNAEIISSNLPNFPLRINQVVRDNKKFLWLPNGYDQEEMLNTRQSGFLFEDIIPKNQFLIGYLGSLGIANALEYFVEAACILKDSKVSFLIVGEGEKLNELKEFAKQENLENILFLPKVNKNQVSSVIKKLDVCFIGWHNSKLYDYGIAPNKIPEYLILGKPILHSFSGANDPIALADAGISVPAEDPVAIADAIRLLKTCSKTDLKNMGLRGRQYAIDNYNYEAVADLLAQEIMS